VALADHRREFVNREEFGAAQRLFWPDERSIRVGLRETHPIVSQGVVYES